MSEDPLQLCPVEKWSELLEIFQDDWPRSISCIIVLEMQRYLSECGLDYGCKVFCPYNNGRYGVVAINKTKGLNQVIVQCPSNDTSKLEDALKTTCLIDWEKEIEIPFVPNNVINCIQRVSEIKNVAIDLTIGLTYALDKSSTLFNVTVPPGYTFESLSLEHADLISATWPHRYDGSDFYFEYIIKAKLGYGLFKGKKLVSWALVRDTGPLLHLFTVQEERRKGYGELVLKLISNVLLNNNKYVVAYCVKDNMNAIKLYQKLNFHLKSEIDWLLLTKKS